MKGAALGNFSVSYRAEPVETLLERPGTLAVLSFGESTPHAADPRHLRILQAPLAPAAPSEYWSVDGDVSHGFHDGLHWSRGGGWQFVAVEVDEEPSGGIEAASGRAYDRLLAHVVASEERYLLRIWNYLGAINAGDGDDERYRQFCNARARSMAAHGVTRYPAATAIGHRGQHGRLQVYALAAAREGAVLENPRQVSAWRYPRQYGPTPPHFARAMQLPNGGLAISGTAAVIGHASCHAGDIAAQAEEAMANLDALLERAALSAFDAASPLKAYIRNPDDIDTVSAVLDKHLDPAVPRLLLQGDICRRELLVEIDGWRFENPA